jgi:hypothetical protein
MMMRRQIQLLFTTLPTNTPSLSPSFLQMLIEFGPGDAAGTAGCDPAFFVESMYANGYSLWEWGYRVPLETLVMVNVPAAVNGTGRRVFEAWFIRDDYVESISKIEAGTGRRKLVSDIGR